SAVDVGKAIREIPATQPAGQPQELVSRLAERFADGKEIRWMTYQNIQQGRPAKVAKTIMNDPRGYERVIFRDSERVLCFTPQPKRVQVDIFSLSNAFPEGVFDFDQLGLTCHTALERGTVKSFQTDPDGYSIRFDWPAVDSKIWTSIITLSSDLILKKQTGIWDGQVMNENWYLCPEQIGSCQIPRVIVEAQQNGPFVDVILIEKLELNPQFSDEQLRAPEIPEGAVVVDYRGVNREGGEKPKVTTYTKAATTQAATASAAARPETPSPIVLVEQSGRSDLGLWGALGGVFVVGVIAFGAIIYRRMGRSG
ncbi:MAG TPA: hypothetical protein VHP11_10050, partial [Tepidisphaeraceae bacterium]|nr:hypothetical protein [Tepidisphaeraceae bacterium]